VTAEEVISGAFAEIRRESKHRQGTIGYKLLANLLGELKRFQLLPFDDESLLRFHSLPPSARRVGRADCMIAVSAIQHGFTVITRNLRDFTQIPGVTSEDWTAPLGAQSLP
jgi:tRNA(fMet)-specific endonuclease VapC